MTREPELPWLPKAVRSVRSQEIKFGNRTRKKHLFFSESPIMNHFHHGLIVVVVWPLPGQVSESTWKQTQS